MSIGELLRKLRYFLFRDRYTADLEEEIRTHIDLRAQQLQRDGVTAGEARFAARRRFGNAIAVEETSRDAWGLSRVEQVIGDARHAVRRLRRRPGFSVAAITILALGIGATTAVFSATDAAILRPLPFARPNELVTLTNIQIPTDQTFPGRRVPDITNVAAMTDVFAHVAGFAAGGLNLIDDAQPERIRAGVVTRDFFATLGVQPREGRTFDEAEGRPNGPPAVVLSDAFWTRRFGRTEMVGKSIDLNGKRYSVVGVMPEGFNFPNESDLWIPLSVPTTHATFEPFRGYLPSQIVARLAPGVSTEAAGNRLLAIWTAELASLPPREKGRRYNIETLVDEVRQLGATVPLQRQLLGDRRGALLILVGATSLLLVIACANVANLLLSDGARRRREIALRQVLGASRGRIVRQLLAESVVLAATGATIGVAAAPPLLGLVRAMLPDDLAGVAPAHLDLRVLAFAVALALVTGVAFGLMPALRATRDDAGAAINTNGGYAATSATLGYTRRALITLELSLTVMLLIGAGLMLRSLEHVLSLDIGLQSDQVATLELSFPDAQSPADRVAAIHAIVDRLGQNGVIQSAAFINDLPLRSNGGIAYLVSPDGQPRVGSRRNLPFARYLIATDGYFKTLGISIVRGRSFSASNTSGSPEVVINAAMAARFWPNADPIGKTFHFASDSLPATVVGVVADVREARLEEAVEPQMYFSVDRRTVYNVALVARATTPTGALLQQMIDAVHAVAPTQAIYNARSMDAVVARSTAPRRTNTVLISLFGGAALLLAMFGAYAVIAYSVAQRGREFGIRAALGASRRDIAGLVAKEMSALTILGIAIGLAAAWALSRVLSAMLYQVGNHDPFTFATAPVVLLVAAAVATAIPVRRAMRADPMEVIRAE